MLYVEQELPPLRDGQVVTGMRVIISTDPTMENIVFEKIITNDTLSVGISEDEFELEDIDYFVFTQCITNFGYTVTTDGTMVRGKEDDDRVILTKLPINFEPDTGIYYPKEFHPLSFFYLVGSNDDAKHVGTTYSYIIEHFDSGIYHVVYAELDVNSNKAFVDMMLKPTTTYRITIITKYSNLSTTTYRYNIFTAPLSDLGLPIEKYNNNVDIIKKPPGVVSIIFMHRDGSLSRYLPKAYSAGLVIMYDDSAEILAYEYYFHKRIRRLLIVET